MAIKINNVTVIDDSSNFSSIGIVTVGSGSSLTNIDSLANFTVGAGVTFDGRPGNVRISGILTAAGLSLPLDLG